MATAMFDSLMSMILLIKFLMVWNECGFMVGMVRLLVSVVVVGVLMGLFVSSASVMEA